MSEQHDELPTNWAWTTLGGLGTWSGGGTPSKANKAFWTNGTIPWVSPKDMKSGRIRTSEDFITRAAVEQSSAKYIPADSVLMVTRSGILSHTFPVAVNDREITVNQDLKVLSPFCGVQADYIAWYLRAQNSRILAGCSKQGTTVASIDTDRLKKFLVPIAPVNEQRRIVDRIEMLFAQLDKGEEALRAVQRQLARYRQSVLKAAVTGQLTADWRAKNAQRLEHGRDLLARILQTRREAWDGRGKYKEAMEPDTTELPKLPTSWVWASIDQISVHLTSGSRDWKRYYGRGHGVFIMAQNVRPMHFDLTKKFPVDPPLDSPDAKRSEARLDDILITIVGANTGDTCRFDRGDQRHFVCQSVALLRLAEPEWARFVELHLNGKGAGRDQIERHIYGAGRPHLSFEQLRTLAVPVLSSEERDEIVDRVSAIMARIELLERLCREQLARSSALRQSVLKDAFAGRLVPQDPADEPAAELLARMQDVARSASTRRGRSRA
ncbi:restriction endonuclease subunit S [Devosia sp. FKR38]|uniref:restriction endonuclease subunit S n=1 Tax=Devosia sp. FKR38 TaxID=2562312 RepID=UPI0010BFE7FA|nr:restriction endonuclease subunit S [Devosia sp. FKR38]